MASAPLTWLRAGDLAGLAEASHRPLGLRARARLGAWGGGAACASRPATDGTRSGLLLRRRLLLLRRRRLERPLLGSLLKLRLRRSAGAWRSSLRLELRWRRSSCTCCLRPAGLWLRMRRPKAGCHPRPAGLRLQLRRAARSLLSSRPTRLLPQVPCLVGA